jgi:hypothetical protein
VLLLLIGAGRKWRRGRHTLGKDVSSFGIREIIEEIAERTVQELNRRLQKYTATGRIYT